MWQLICCTALQSLFLQISKGSLRFPSFLVCILLGGASEPNALHQLFLVSRIEKYSYEITQISWQKHAYRYGFSPNANCPICPCTDSALHILSGCQNTKMRNMIIKRHNMASVLIVQALQKGPCGANQIAYTDIGSADKLSEQGLNLRNTANKHCPLGCYQNYQHML